MDIPVYLCIFVHMKLIALIFTLFLSLFSGGKDLCTGGLPPEGSSCAVFESTSKDNLPECSFNKDICLASAQTFSFEGSDNSSVSLQTRGNGRRTNSQSGRCCSFVKSGKFFNNNTNPYLSPSLLCLSGCNEPERYRISICILRI